MAARESAELLEELLRTQDDVQRDRVAIELAERGEPNVVAAIVEVLERPDRPRAGTLIGALTRFDVRAHLELVVEIFCTGNYEESVMAHRTLHTQRGSLPEAQRRACLIRLRRCAGDMTVEPERRTAALALMDHVTVEPLSATMSPLWGSFVTTRQRH